MKRSILLTTLALLFTMASIAQCWQQPQCCNEVNFVGTLANKNYNKSTCFTGTGIIKNSVNVNNWDFISYTGSIQVDGPTNMNNKSNVYANGSIIFDQVHFTGGDTLFVNGAVIINKVVSNNSNEGSKNVIFLSETSSLIIAGHPYTSGTLQLQGNESNSVDIISCSSSALPVTISKLEVMNGVLTWENILPNNIKNYTIQGSDDAITWNDVQVVNADQRGYAIALGGANLAYIGGLLAIILLGLLVPKKRLKTAILSLLFIGFAAISCTKNSPAKNQQNTKYKLYRLLITYQDGSTDYSQVVNYK
jgi:hypothetical protein